MFGDVIEKKAVPLSFVKKELAKIKELKNGESYNAVGENTLVKYSMNDYESLCIIFVKKPVDRKGKPVEKICNAIPESMRSVENYEKRSKGEGCRMMDEGKGR